MEQGEVIGALADGGTYRATSYLVELRDAGGNVTATLDANEIAGIQRRDRTVVIRRRSGASVVVEAASLEDAGRLESAIRAAVPAIARAGGGGRGLGCFLIGCLVLLVVTIGAAAVIGFVVFRGVSSLAEESDYTIRVSGTAGTSFSGTYAVVSLAGDSVAQTVTGSVPTEYNAGRGNLVTVTFEKGPGPGTLRVEILKGGRVVGTSETSEPFGSLELLAR